MNGWVFRLTLEVYNIRGKIKVECQVSMGLILIGFWLCNDINAEGLFTFDFEPFGEVGSHAGDLKLSYMCCVFAATINIGQSSI
jgi:hypothetical protein